MPRYKRRLVRRYGRNVRARRAGNILNAASLYGPSIATGAAYLGSKLWGKFKKKGSSGRGVTTQHDVSRIYRKRRMPRRKRKAWGRFSRKVHAVVEKTLGSRTIVYNSQISVTTPAGTTEQATGQVALYPVANATHAHLNDLNAIQANFTGNTGYDRTQSLIFQSGVLDMTIQNESIDTAEEGAQVEMDIYEISSNDSWQQEGSTNVGLTKVFSEGFTNTSNEGSATNGLSLVTRGVTPFDCCEGLSEYKIKIWKKKKYFLGPGQTMTYQIRDPKRHKFNNEKLKDWDSSNMPRVTKWLLIIAKTTPGYDLTTSGKVDLRVGLTRKYMYKIMESSHDADALNP